MRRLDAGKISPLGAVQSADPVRLAYLVARFPKVTETFVVRELNEVDAYDEINAELFALFRPQASSAHPSAQAWVDRVHRPSLLSAASAFIRRTIHQPLTMLSTVVLLIRGFWRHPRLLLSSFGALLVACAHADTMVRLRIEHVHAHFAGNTATAAWVIRRLTGIEYSITTHAYDLFQDQAFLAPRLRDARFVIAISRFNERFLENFCQGSAPPIFLVRAGVDLKRFRYIERRLPATGPVRALCVASLLPHKGHRVVLQALAEADPDIKRINLDVVGDGPERSDLEAQIRELGLEKRVRLHGSLPEDEVAAMFDHADLFVLPSVIAANGRMEGVPVVLMEALACGVPAVATRLSGVPELVEDKVTGTLAEQGDVASMGAALKRVLNDPDRAAAMARAGRQRVVEEYDVVASAEMLAQQFVAVAREPSERAQRRRPAFIAWSRSDRSRELALAVGGDSQAIFLSRFVKPGLVPIRYAISGVATSLFLLRKRPSAVVATNPPIFPALIAYVYCRLAGARLILDSHPRGFGHKGSRLGTAMTPLHRFLVRRAAATLVASNELADTVRNWGGRAEIVHEAPPLWSIQDPPSLSGEPTVMWVCIYANDEPVADVLEAARQLPECRFLITGDVRRCPPELRSAAPSNVEFTGYWGSVDFRALIERSDIMMVFTTERTSVPRGAFEAVEALRPLVLSEWPHLHDTFPDAVFVRTSPDAMAEGVRSAVSRHGELTAAAHAARDRQRTRWEGQRAQLALCLSEKSPEVRPK
jgi:glycosyltransferase involved in cell wall biosynthesis